MTSAHVDVPIILRSRLSISLQLPVSTTQLTRQIGFAVKISPPFHLGVGGWEVGQGEWVGGWVGRGELGSIPVTRRLWGRGFHRVSENAGVLARNHYTGNVTCLCLFPSVCSERWWIPFWGDGTCEVKLITGTVNTVSETDKGRFHNCN